MNDVASVPVAKQQFATPKGFALYHDPELTLPTPYHSGGHYFAMAKDRMDRTFRLIEPLLKGATVVDIGASPFYLLYRAKAAGAVRCHGTFFANDAHPLRNMDVIHSDAGAIEISHSNAETDPLPLAEDAADVLTACEILEHFDYFPAHLASEMRRVIKPGGYLCITVPNVHSIANILKLVARRNIYMRYRSDMTGRHKHEYTLGQLRAFVEYLKMDIVRIGVLPSPTSDKRWLRPFYRAMAKVPVVSGYSPILYVLARQPQIKVRSDLSVFPPALFEAVNSIEG